MTTTPGQPHSGPATVELVELIGISASFTPLELEGLVRTAAEAVYGDDDDLSTRQRELASRAHALMAQEAEDTVESPGAGYAAGGYARMQAIKNWLNTQALAVEQEFTALLRTLFPRAAYMVMHIEEDDSFTLRRAVTAQGTPVHLFDDPGYRTPDVPDELARLWRCFPQGELDLDQIVDELREAGVTFGSLPEEARDLEIDDRYAYVPCIDLQVDVTG
ncbi:hypothetical protein MHW47_00265 [Streptomyces sp. OfavH-34-F]|uniref:hypothetical protein n=1 Tax=Streptomyces sp. OfavH-34-F TaxID=2917760 RepID=UPI001EF37E9A|nr:hypothetical protein [Streptomyces sp. OfavH-34-F]MCG7522889.1 hypothetical protein [Streptomyces sp. OfavH-34-F]